MNQIMTGGRLEAYSSLGDLALIRTSCDSAIPAAALDRTLLMFGSRLYDIFMVRSGMPYTFDLPYHSHGVLKQSVATAPWADHPQEKPGYAYFDSPLAGSVDGGWQCDWTVPKGRVIMRVAGEPGTEVIAATTPKGGSRSFAGEKEAGREQRLCGAGELVAEGITRLTDKETRSLVLGHLQRGGGPSTFDRLLALRFGAA